MRRKLVNTVSRISRGRLEGICPECGIYVTSDQSKCECGQLLRWQPRLTVRVSSGVVYLVDHENNDMKLEPCEMNSHHCRLAIEKVDHYECLEDKGQLLELPCSVGDTVFILVKSGQGEMIRRGTVDRFEINSYGTFVITSIGNFNTDDFGKIVYVEYEEMEDK